MTYSLSPILSGNGYATVSWDPTVLIGPTMAVTNVYSIPNLTTVLPSDDNSGGGNTQNNIVLRIALFCLAGFFALLVLAYFVFSVASPQAAAAVDAADATGTKTTAETSGKEQVPAYGLVEVRGESLTKV